MLCCVHAQAQRKFESHAAPTRSCLPCAVIQQCIANIATHQVIKAEYDRWSELHCFA